MLDSTIEALCKELSHRHPPAARNRTDIETCGLPHAISSFLIADLERTVYDELRRLHPASLKWVDADDGQIGDSFDALAETVIERARIPEDDWNDSLRRAVSATVHAFENPRGALTDFVFGATDATLSGEEAASLATAFPIHQAMRAAVAESVSRRPTETFGKDRFRSIVDKVDALRTDGFTAAAWFAELTPLYRLMEEAGLSAVLPTKAVAAFLAARGCPSAAERVAASGEGALPLRKATVLVESVPKPSPSEIAHDEDVLHFTQGEPERAATPSRSGGNETVPLWKRFQKNLNAPMTTPASSGERADRGRAASAGAAESAVLSRVARSTDEHHEKTHRPLWQQYRSAKPASEEKEIDLHAMELSVLGKEAAEKRGTFIGDLFKGEEEAYLKTVIRLASAGTWGEASQVIAEQVFKRYQINIYSEPAVAFTNAVEARYRARRVGA